MKKIKHLFFDKKNTTEYGNAFQNFKRRFLSGAIIKSAIFSLSLGVLIASIILVVLKTVTVSFSHLWYILPAVGICALSFGVMLLILCPTDRKAAKRLDETLDLGERAQTMVAYRDKDGDMLEFQRRDTEERLSVAPVKKTRGRNPWKHVLAPLLAIAMLSVAIIVPAKELPAPEPGPEDAAYELSDWERSALLELIEEVKASKMQEEPKSATVLELERLLAALEATEKQGAMKTLVIGTIASIAEIKNSANSNAEIAKAIQYNGNSLLKTLSENIEDLSGPNASVALNDIRDKLKRSADPKGDSKTLAEDIMLALVASNIEESDPLYAAMSHLAAALNEKADLYDSYTKAWFTEQLDAIFLTASDNVGAAVLDQYYNSDVAYTAIRRLMNIFGITESEIPAESVPEIGSDSSDNSYEDEEDDKPINSGGLGDADVLYGSNDRVYDPDETDPNNIYKEYKEIVNKYNGILTEKIIDGTLPEEVQKYLLDYFDKLFSGSDEDTES